MRDVISSLMGNPYRIMRKTEQQQSADYHFLKGPPLQESSFDGLSGKRPSKVWISQEWHFFWENPYFTLSQKFVTSLLALRYVLLIYRSRENH